MEPVAVGGASVVHYSLGQLEGGFDAFAVVDGVDGGGLAEVGGVGHGVEGGHFRVVVGKALSGGGVWGRCGPETGPSWRKT